MRTITKEIYKFGELDEGIQENIIKKFREHHLDYKWWDFIFEDAKEIGKLLGINIKNIYFSGFSNQGDGACFTGSYEYKKGSLRAIKAHAPMDKELHRIVLELSKTQRPYFYQLSARVEHRGHYYHEMCTDIQVHDNKEDYGLRSDFSEAEDGIKEFLRDFMRWIYRRLECQHGYLISDESIREHIICNEHEFDENGDLV